MYSSREERIKIWDEERQQTVYMIKDDVEDQLDRLKQFIEEVLEKLKLDGYELAGYKIGVSLKAGIFIITAEGQVTLSFDKVKPS